MMLKRFAGGFFCCLFFATVFWGTKCEAQEPDSLYAASAVLMDGKTGRVLFSKNGDEPMPMASTTKIMTCILILELCEPDEKVSVSAYAASMPKVKLNLWQGESYTVQDLLYSLMLESHNDTAVALAEHVGKAYLEKEVSEKEEKDFTREESIKAVEAFAKLMNEKAAEIGCVRTCFLTPNGLDAVKKVVKRDGTEAELKHVTTAKELAMIMAYCLNVSPQAAKFRTITATKSYSFSGNGRNYSCYNHNAFLEMMDGALSGKTGFTNQAGYCYTGALEKDGRQLVVALLACGWPNHKSYKWSDTKKLMEYGLTYFRPVSLEEALFEETKLPKLTVVDGKTSDMWETCEIPLLIAGRSEVERVNDYLAREEERIFCDCKTIKSVQAPVAEGTVVGRVSYTLGDDLIYTEDIVTAEGVEKVNFGWYLIHLLIEYAYLDVKK